METSTSTTTAAETTAKVKNRASARSQVAQQWASRRLSASERPTSSSSNNTIASSTATAEGGGAKQHPRKPLSAPTQQHQQQQQQHQQQQPSLCHIIGKAWQEALLGISKQLPLKPASSLTNNAITSSSSSATGTAVNNKKAHHKKEKGKSQLRTFPSVLQILQATALHQQVEHFHENNGLENQEHALRVLPQGYNWNKAIVNMAQSRSRAFLLLDLASIVPTLVNWKQICKGIQFMYTVQYNADPKLLQLLLRSNVGLVCTNKWDLERSRQAFKELPTSQQHQLYDNAITTGKPDGYLRHLVLDAQVDTVVVDGPEEVMRIAQALKRMRQRRQQTDPLDKLNFILRLPSATEISIWEDLVERTQQAIKKCQQLSLIHTALLSGISVDALQDYDNNTAKESMIFAKLEQILEALASSDQPANDLRLDLTGVTMPPTNDMLEWWSRWSKFCNKITVDVSHALISPAGALCTRIIGVKDEQDEVSGITKRHYYIDDGCYGSLYSPACDNNCNKNSSISNPLPLLYDEEAENDNNNAVNASKPQEEPQISVIWGPTCDGLDKVAHDIMLPKLHRDQWLFFPNLGCRIGEGLGTAFNGFAPPDTAYCVLGYFGK